MKDKGTILVADSTPAETELTGESLAEQAAIASELASLQRNVGDVVWWSITLPAVGRQHRV